MRIEAGLTSRGRVPKGKPCPFISICLRVDERCPSEANTKDNDFSCALARGLSIDKDVRDDLIKDVEVE